MRNCKGTIRAMEGKTGQRVLVCGGRDFWEQEVVNAVLDRFKPSLLIEGGGPGADKCAQTWGQKALVPVMTFTAPWGKAGKGAGPLRNKWMLTIGAPDLVIAFPGGKGTADMKKQAKERGVPVWEYEKVGGAA